LTLDRRTHWGDAHGLFAHAFRRQGMTSIGLIGFAHGSDHLLGLVGTESLIDRVYLTLAGTTASSPDTDPKRLTLDAEYDYSSYLAFTGRLEWGEYSPFPVAGITFYPVRQGILRLSAETVQQPGNRTFTFFARLQL
jgi:hypothetical protein